MLRIVLFVFLSFISTTQGIAFAQDSAIDPFQEIKPEFIDYDPATPMHFFLNRVKGGANTPDDYWIAAEGMITKDTPNLFFKFLTQDPFYLQEKQSLNPDSHFQILYLHSCGGNEEAAMKLGLIFKDHQFEIRIGQTYPSDIAIDSSYNEPEIDKGECRGACILAALGGSSFTENDLEDMQRIDLGHGETKNDAQYYPILLPSFRSPVNTILNYAKEKGSDADLLSRLLSESQGKTLELGLADTWRLGIGIIPDLYSKAIPPELIRPCPSGDH